ncbi:hypothetical protein [Vibrio phage vB_VibM_10AMN]|uniref:DOD-type homing endonuclease domain-containing protein n=1 Tax=Staphylococcus phage vB_VibM_10AMN12 TaxID=3076785 RepID=A0AA96KSQ6_9CAUD|nr:hypothetical protein [Vibrio phage vB_VibM_10AMN]WNO47567.1 hypothetical protein [Staphylococcus phage vB_VibM_10AMN12]
METFSGYTLISKELDLPFDTSGYNIIPKTYPFGSEPVLIETGYKGFIPNKHTTNLKAVNIPTHYTEDLCKFIGYFVANGSYGENHINFCTLDKGIVEDYIRITKSVFGVDVETRSYGSKVVNYVISSVVIKDFLVNTVFKGKHTARFKIVPEGIRKSSKRCIRSFLLGLLDCDSYLERKYSFIFNTASDNVAKFIHEVLLGFGIVSNLRPFNGVKGYEDHTYWDVRVAGKYIYKLYSNVFGEDSLVYKNFPEERKVNTNFDFIPNLNTWLDNEIKVIRRHLNVLPNGVFKEGGANNRFKISSGFKIELDKNTTYEFVDKVLNRWQQLPQNQRKMVNHIEKVLLYIKENDCYFDKIISDQ